MRDTLKNKIRKGCGGKIPMDMRPNWAEFIKGSNEIYIKYDWIRDKRFWEWMHNNPYLEFGEGMNGVTIWIK